MLNDDEVLAAELALAGPCAHVPEVLVHRIAGGDRIPEIDKELRSPVGGSSTSPTHSGGG
jgi:hypothetical protein